MTCLIQARKTINEFYQKVYSHLYLILYEIGCMEIGDEAVNLLTENYRAKALDTFVRGLSGDLPRLLGITKPKSLPEAFHIYLKLENQSFRATYANNQNTKNATSFNTPLNYQQQYPRQQYPQQLLTVCSNPQLPDPQSSQTRFHPELAYLPQPLPKHNSHNYQYPQKKPPTICKPWPKSI